MPTVIFTPNLRRHVACPTTTVGGSTVRQVLENVFAQNPPGRGYVLDDQGSLRTHVVIFIDGVMISDRKGLSDSVQPSSEVYVMQALSGG
ncbi:MAG: MoaD/ThiS family protein [Planctomycetota bacterium]|nr:MoaD/ThiS family protein [Planctomycetota bacterium]